VTYTGDVTSVRSISHNLGSTPGCIIVKRTDSTGDWSVYHRSLGVAGGYIRLNLTAAASGTAFATPINSTVFSIESGAPASMNVNGATYVAYLFAHDAGGFGLSGTDNVITCGSYTTNGSSTATVNLGYEPQFVIAKASSTTSSWLMNDNMRGFTTSSAAGLFANTSGAEGSYSGLNPTSTGFVDLGMFGASVTVVYIAIRRPMKPPTSGTSVFSPAFGSSSGNYTVVAGFPVDSVFYKNKSGVEDNFNRSRLLGGTYLVPNTTAAEVTNANGLFDSNTTFYNNLSGNFSNYIHWLFRRAPGFFDVVCDTGTASAHTINHGLTVVPELMIRKKRNSATNSDWVVWHTLFSGTSKYLYLNDNAAEATNSTFWTTTAPTSTVFSVGTGSRTNETGDTYVTYLFATVAGVSKVGSYTGTGTTLTIDCGFTAGARFVLIKRTSSTGDWYVWDTARGIISGNDPYLLLNSTAAEVTNTDYIDPVNSGFQISSTAPVQINQSGGTFIFLAIA